MLRFMVFCCLFLFVACKSEKSSYIKNYSLEYSRGEQYTYFASEHIQKEVPRVQLVPLEVYNEITNTNSGKGLLLADVFCVQSLDDGFLINDDLGGRLILVDRDFQLRGIIGRKGKGPGEFIQPRYSIIDDGKIYSSGTANKGFVVHDLEGKMLTEFKSRSETNDRVISKFTVLNEEIYLSSPNADKSVKVIDKEGTVVNEFGMPLRDFIKDSPLRHNSRGHILKSPDNKEIIFVGETVPVIQKFSASGALRSSHNLIDHPYFSSFFAGVQERIRQSKRNDMDYLLVQDAQMVDQDNLYLLVYAYDSTFQISLNKILHITGIEDSNIVLEQELELTIPDDLSDVSWFESFTIEPSRNEVLAFESISSSFVKYKLR